LKSLEANVSQNSRQVVELLEFCPFARERHMFQWLSSAKILHVQHMSNIGSVDCDHESPTEITLGEMRSSGPRRLLVYCGDYRFAHSVVMNSDQWSDDIRRGQIWSRGFPTKPRAAATPTSGRFLSQPPWERADRNSSPYLAIP
jgi:hypothetical protein